VVAGCVLEGASSLFRLFAQPVNINITVRSNASSCLFCFMCSPFELCIFWVKHLLSAWILYLIHVHFFAHNWLGCAETIIPYILYH